jgi:hypothetical protein
LAWHVRDLLDLRHHHGKRQPAHGAASRRGHGRLLLLAFIPWFSLALPRLLHMF